MLRDDKMPDLSNRKINLQTRNLRDTLPKDTRAEIEPLRSVFRIAYPDGMVTANNSEEQMKIAHRFRVNFEGEYSKSSLPCRGYNHRKRSSPE